jgi:Zn-dependent protease
MERIRMEHQPDPAPETTSPEENPLLAQLRAIGSEESKLNSLTLLILTVVLFFSAGIVSATVEEVVILVGVLLFHELGHLAAMKLLGYRDVKMFFIPFLGAAVSGKSKSDSSLKSSFVSLMGPLPGLVLGVVLYVLFTLTRNYYLLKAAQMMLLLNAMNLLPIMPLDGGRYIDVLFVRNRLFRFLFAPLGVAAFGSIAIAGQDFFMGVLAFFALMGAITNLKLNAITNELAAQGVQASSVEDLLNNPASLEAVLGSLLRRFPRLANSPAAAKTIHGHLTHIVTTLRFVPAKAFGKIALVLLYIVILLPSLGATLFFVWMNYTEKLRTEYSEHGRTAYLDRYVFGRHYSAIPLDSNLCFHGQGAAFRLDSSIVEAQYEYTHGYRTGRWLEFDALGDTTHQTYYTEGKLDSVRAFAGGDWRTTHFAQLPAHKRLFQTISYHAQPYRSNHHHFKE